jgi:hypothetical protein
MLLLGLKYAPIYEAGIQVKKLMLLQDAHLKTPLTKVTVQFEARSSGFLVKETLGLSPNWSNCLGTARKQKPSVCCIDYRAHRKYIRIDIMTLGWGVGDMGVFV